MNYRIYLPKLKQTADLFKILNALEFQTGRLACLRIDDLKMRGSNRKIYVNTGILLSAGFQGFEATHALVPKQHSISLYNIAPSQLLPFDVADTKTRKVMCYDCIRLPFETSVGDSLFIASSSDEKSEQWVHPRVFH